MKVLVCGGRDFEDRMRLFLALDEANRNSPFSFLIHGDSRGCDWLADQWAYQRGVQRVICPAAWNIHKLAAGPIRNRRMLELLPDLVIAFPGGSGTADMVEAATKKGVRVVQA